MTDRSQQIERLVRDGAARLIARASEARSVESAALAPRLRATLDKYLLRDDSGASDSDIIKFLNDIHADDLCLVMACERGDDAAWHDLVERFGATVRSAARSASGNEDAAEDLAQSIWAELHGLRRGGNNMPAGKIAYYSGRGSLGGWLRAVVGQLAVDQHRKSSRFVQTEAESDFDRVPEGGGDGFAGGRFPLDQEKVLEQRRSSADLEMALNEVIAGLAAEDRLLVKLYYFDGLNLREAGAVLGVHEATASRRLARIQSEIRKSVETKLMKEHGWTAPETVRSLSEAAAHLDTDLELMFTEGGIACEKHPIRPSGQQSVGKGG